MGLEYWWRYAQKRWTENLRILKTRQLTLTLDHGGRILSSLPLSWSWELKFNRWRCSWVFRISTDRYLNHYKMRCALLGSESMVRNSKNCVSLLVSMNWSQEINKLFVNEQQIPPAFVHVFVSIVFCIYELMAIQYNISLAIWWLWKKKKSTFSVRTFRFVFSLCIWALKVQNKRNYMLSYFFIRWTGLFPHLCSFFFVFFSQRMTVSLNQATKTEK